MNLEKSGQEEFPSYLITPTALRLLYSKLRPFLFDGAKIPDLSSDEIDMLLWLVGDEEVFETQLKIIYFDQYDINFFRERMLAALSDPNTKKQLEIALGIRQSVCKIILDYFCK